MSYFMRNGPDDHSTLYVQTNKYGCSGLCNQLDWTKRDPDVTSFYCLMIQDTWFIYLFFKVLDLRTRKSFFEKQLL